MLVLNRRRGEGIWIGEGESAVHIVILDTGRQIRVGIEAPDSIKIRRDELEPLPKIEPLPEVG